MGQIGVTLLLPVGSKDPGSSFGLLRHPQCARECLVTASCIVSTDAMLRGLEEEELLLESPASYSASSGTTPVGRLALLLLR